MKYELIQSTVNPLRNIFWYLVPGTTVSLRPFTNDDQAQFDICDWLCDNVGKQGKDWDWRINYPPIHRTIGPSSHGRHATLHIKCRKAKQKYATYLMLKWS